VAVTKPVLVAERDLGLGDLLTAIPALRALARAFPAHRRVLVAPSALAPLLALARTGFELAAEPPPQPDVAVNLHGRGPQSHARLLETEPRRLVAFACAAHPGPRWRPGEHEVVRWCRLLEESGIPADPGDLDLALAPPAAANATVIHPGAASAARRWPAERWGAVARAEAADGGEVVVTGSAHERGLAERVAAGVPRATVLAGRTGLAELTTTVAQARRVLCGDTGVAHLATALGTPSVVLFGPTPPSEWGPPPDRPRHTVLWAGRRGDPHAATPDPGLLEIQVADVLAAVRAHWPKATSSPARTAAPTAVHAT
jgi:ADP-heptose:LPS heptosyltransferase